MRKFTPRERALFAKEYALKYPRISRFPYNPSARIAEFQLKKIRKMVELAYSGTRFYRELYKANSVHPNDIRTWADFKKLPTLSKSDIIDNRPDCIVTAKEDGRNLRVSYSSGSSGQMLEIVADTDRWIQTGLIMLRMFQQSLRFGPLSRIALIYTSPYPFLSRWGPYRVKHIHTLTPPGELIKSLLHLRPSLIIAYPSVLMELAAKYPRQCRDLSVRGIATNSEHSTQQQRDALSEVFKAPVCDEYSTEELGFVGFQCRHKKYHLQEDSGYLEILDPDGQGEMESGQVGEIVGTSFVHNVMPFIRYRQGDLGSIIRSVCPCGSNGRELDNISGRKNSSFKLPNGELIPSGKVLDWTYKLILEHSLPIMQFQVIQKALCSVEVVIITGMQYSSEKDDRTITASFQQQFGHGLQVSVRRVKTIPRTPAGKHIPILSLVEPPEGGAYTGTRHLAYDKSGPRSTRK